YLAAVGAGADNGGHLHLHGWLERLPVAVAGEPRHPVPDAHADGHALRHRRAGGRPGGGGDGLQPHRRAAHDRRLPAVPALLPAGHRRHGGQGMSELHTPALRGPRTEGLVRSMTDEARAGRPGLRSALTVLAAAVLALTGLAAAQQTITFWPSSNPEEIEFAR